MSLRGPALLSLYNRFLHYPFGRTAFSLLFSFQAPYFLSIRPTIVEFKSGFSQVSMTQRWWVQNHIKTIHAIAVCNLIEMTMGLMVEGCLPNHLRWLPMGMDVEYKKKTKDFLIATAAIDEKTFFTLEKYPGKVSVPVFVKNKDDVITTEAKVHLWLSEKPLL